MEEAEKRYKEKREQIGSDDAVTELERKRKQAKRESFRAARKRGDKFGPKSKKMNKQTFNFERS